VKYCFFYEECLILHSQSLNSGFVKKTVFMLFAKDGVISFFINFLIKIQQK